MAHDFDIKNLQTRMDNVINSFKHELSGLRTGRASANLLDPIMVEAYGSYVPLNQVANITVPEPRMLSVSIWDKSMVSAVDKAIRESKLNLNPIVDGNNLRIPLPALNEERRKELVRIAHQYAEQARVAVRHVRRDGVEDVRKLEKDSQFTKDEAFHKVEEIQKLTDKEIAKIEAILAEKEAEIMHV